MDSFNIGAAGGILLSLAFKYVPKLKVRFEALEPETKQLVNLSTLVVVVAGAYGLSCLNWHEIYACTQVGLKDAILGLTGAVIGNASAYVTLSYQAKS